MVRILPSRVNRKRSAVDARKKLSSESIIPCSSLPGTKADLYQEMISSKARCAPPPLSSLLVALVLIVGAKAMNSVAAIIVCMKVVGKQTTANVTKVVRLQLRKSPMQPFPVKSSCRSLSSEAQPQNFRDISGRLNQHPRFQLWFVLCLVEFATTRVMLMLPSENVLRSWIVHIGF